jgi:phage gpG-like protein
MRIQIKITGDEQTIQRLQKLGDRLGQWQPELNQIGGELETYFSGRVFASQGGAIGQNWQRLSPGYAKWKAKHYPGRPPLVRTGKMIGGFRHSATNTKLEVTNRMPYFKYHQSSAPRTKIPYRPMMAANDDVKTIVATIIDAGVRKRLSGAGL